MVEFTVQGKRPGDIILAELNLRYYVAFRIISETVAIIQASSYGTVDQFPRGWSINLRIFPMESYDLCVSKFKAGGCWDYMSSQIKLPDSLVALRWV